MFENEGEWEGGSSCLGGGRPFSARKAAERAVDADDTSVGTGFFWGGGFVPQLALEGAVREVAASKDHGAGGGGSERAAGVLRSGPLLQRCRRRAPV